MIRALQAVSALVVPALLLLIPWYAYLKRVPVYEEFVRGAARAFGVGVRIIPYLVAMLVAVAVLRASGALDYLSSAVAPLTRSLGLPPDLLPLALVRPLSGSGALALLAEATRVHGPDSYAGRLAAVMVGCTETTFYVLSVYFGAAGVKRLRYAVTLGIIADVAGLLAAVTVCRLTFGNN
ncbi:MAG: nucleoside recognition domain-containing protein [Bacillota bacterium]|nr:nucleoside recognition domain-containing protein [Bacillota bacterium]